MALNITETETTSEHTCFKCNSIKNLKEENINEDTIVTICKKCYDNDKCSVCHQLFEGEPLKLHDIIDCCKEVKLCLDCKNQLKQHNINACPVCKYDPTPQIEPQYNISPMLNFNYEEYSRWIFDNTGRSIDEYNTYSINNENIKLDHFIQYQLMSKNGIYLTKIMFNYESTSDTLLFRLYHKCICDNPNCSNLVHTTYETNRTIITQEVPHVVPQEVGGAVPQAVTQVVPQAVPQTVPQAVTQVVLQEVGEAVPQAVGEAVPQAVDRTVNINNSNDNSGDNEGSVGGIQENGNQLIMFYPQEPIIINYLPISNIDNEYIFNYVNE